MGRFTRRLQTSDNDLDMERALAEAGGLLEIGDATILTRNASGAVNEANDGHGGNPGDLLKEVLDIRP